MSEDQYTRNSVEFEGERHMLYSRFQPSSEVPGLIQWVIKHSGGLVKDDRQAQHILVGFVGIGIVISIFLFMHMRPSIGHVPLDPKVHPDAIRSR